MLYPKLPAGLISSATSLQSDILAGLVCRSKVSFVLFKIVNNLKTRMFLYSFVLIFICKTAL
jgi:hypothetical protein